MKELIEHIFIESNYTICGQGIQVCPCLYEDVCVPKFEKDMRQSRIIYIYEFKWSKY